MTRDDQQENWRDLQDKLNAAIEAWRREHPEATLTEIEEAVDSRLAGVRRQMVEDLAQEGRTARLRGIPKEERPACPRCGQAVAVNGRGRRKLKTSYGETIELERDQAYCIHCEMTCRLNLRPPQPTTPGATTSGLPASPGDGINPFQ